jgi:hypothetical protein
VGLGDCMQRICMQGICMQCSGVGRAGLGNRAVAMLTVQIPSLFSSTGAIHVPQRIEKGSLWEKYCTVYILISNFNTD